MGIQEWQSKWGKDKPKDKKHIEPFEHGGYIMGEYLAEKSTEEIKRIYARELSQTSLDHRGIRV
jgi:hypothetical protein